MIEQINRYKNNITFKKEDLVFFYNQNNVTNRLVKKLNDEMFGSFKILFVINSFYKLKLFEIMKIYNVFQLKLLNLVIVNLLFNQKKSFFKVIIVKNKNN